MWIENDDAFNFEVQLNAYFLVKYILQIRYNYFFIQKEYCVFTKIKNVVFSCCIQ